MIIYIVLYQKFNPLTTKNQCEYFFLIYIRLKKIKYIIYKNLNFNFLTV